MMFFYFENRVLNFFNLNVIFIDTVEHIFYILFIYLIIFLDYINNIGTNMSFILGRINGIFCVPINVYYFYKL